MVGNWRGIEASGPGIRTATLPGSYLGVPWIRAVGLDASIVPGSRERGAEKSQKRSLFAVYLRPVVVLLVVAGVLLLSLSCTHENIHKLLGSSPQRNSR